MGKTERIHVKSQREWDSIISKAGIYIETEWSSYMYNSVIDLTNKMVFSVNAFKEEEIMSYAEFMYGFDLKPFDIVYYNGRKYNVTLLNDELLLINLDGGWNTVPRIECVDKIYRPEHVYNMTSLMDEGEHGEYKLIYRKKIDWKKIKIGTKTNKGSFYDYVKETDQILVIKDGSVRVFDDEEVELAC